MDFRCVLDMDSGHRCLLPKVRSVYSVQRLAFKAESISEDVNTSSAHNFQTVMSNIIVPMIQSERPKA